MSCFDETYEEKKKKQEVYKHHDFLKTKTCCDKESCDKLSIELQNLQYKCDDAFRNSSTDLDEKGLTRDTLCNEIRLEKENLINVVKSKSGGKKSRKRKNKKSSRKLPVKSFRKSYSKKRIIKGGMNTKNILFGCTTLDIESTLTTNFELVNRTINSELSEYTDIKKDSYFVYPYTYKTFYPFLKSQYFRKTLTDNGYNIVNFQSDEKYIHNYYIVDFLKNTRTYFDVIVFSFCNDLLSIIVGEIKNHTSSSYDLIRENAYVLYTFLNDGGTIINIDDENLEDFDESVSFITLGNNLPLFLYSIEVMELLFLKKSRGIYKKKIVSKEEYEAKCNELKIKTIDYVKNTLSENPKPINFYTEVLDHYNKPLVNSHKYIKNNNYFFDVNEKVLQKRISPLLF